MLNIVAIITPKSEHYDECKRRISNILIPTREEDECMKFDLFEDATQQKLVLVETFLNQQALDAHYAKPYTSEVFDFYRGRLENEPEIHKLNVID